MIMARTEYWSHYNYFTFNNKAFLLSALSIDQSTCKYLFLEIISILLSLLNGEALSVRHYSDLTHQ